jgi:hypothetical protein
MRPCSVPIPVAAAQTARLQRLVPAGVFADDLVRQIGILFGDRRLRARNHLPGFDGFRGEIGDGLDGVVAGPVVDHRERPPRQGAAGKHLLFGRLVQCQDTENALTRKTRGGPEELGSGENLLRGQRGQRMRSGQATPGE